MKALVGLGLLVIIVVWFVVIRRDESEPGDYRTEYGGSAEVYADISRETECEELQRIFDTAAANNDRAEPGTDAHRYTLGYMTAAEDRRQALGC